MRMGSEATTTPKSRSKLMAVVNVKETKKVFLSAEKKIEKEIKRLSKSEAQCLEEIKQLAKRQQHVYFDSSPSVASESSDARSTQN